MKLKRGCIILLLFVSSGWGAVKIHVIDVGFGTAIHIETRTRNFLIDSGPKEEISKILKSLADKKVSRFEAIFISHDHPDHIGALPKILNQIPANFVFWPADFPVPKEIQRISEQGGGFAQIKLLRSGDNLTLDRELSLSVLKSTRKFGNPNDDCLVFGLKSGKMRFLIAGDIGAQRQDELVEIEPIWIKEARWLLWPHHGEKLNSNFLKLFKKHPICVVSVGENPYELPNSDLIPESKSFCQELFRTDEMSDLSFVVKGGKIFLEQIESLKQ